MAALLPLVLAEFERRPVVKIQDDPIEQTQDLSGVPAFALDQFTRPGQVAIRAMIKASGPLQEALRCAGLAQGQWAAVVGDVLFQIEGGLVRRRACWPIADALRLPHRPLSSLVSRNLPLMEIEAAVRAARPLVDELRTRHLRTGQPR